METVTKNGVTYTPASDNAALTYDSSGNVTGISAGTVTVTLEGKTDPKITLNGSTAFSFTAEENDGTLRIVKESHAFNYVSGQATYSADKITFPAGTVGVKLSNEIFSSILGTINVTIPSGGLEVPFDTSGAVTFNLPQAITATVSGGTASGSISLSGQITYDAANKAVTLAKDAAISVSNLKLAAEAPTGLNFAITALADSTLAIDGLYFVFKDGSSVNISGSTFSINGNLTLSDGDLSFNLLYLLSGEISDFSLTAGATVKVDIPNFVPVSITSPEDSSADITFGSGTFKITTTNDKGVNIILGTSTNSPVNVKGTVTFDTTNRSITLAKDTVLAVTLSNGNIAQFTANADATSKFTLSADGTVNLTPNQNDGTLNIKILQPASQNSTLRLLSAANDTSDNEILLDADVDVVSGSISFNLSTLQLDVAAGTVTKFTIGDYVFTYSFGDGAGGTISFADNGGLTYTPNSSDDNLTITIEGTGDSDFENFVIETLNGSFTLNNDDTISLAQGTELKLQSADDFSISFKATDDAGGTLALTSNGVTYTPAENCGNLELTVTNGDTTRTANLEITGTITYTADGEFTLAEGTVVKNVFDDGVAITITSNSDASGTIAFNPESGFTVTPASADAFTAKLDFGDNRYITANSIEGTISLTDGIFTFEDGVAVSGVWNLTGDEEENFKSNVSGGTATVGATEDAVIFTANEGATFVNDFGENETFTISEGSISVTIDGTFTSTISAGTVVKDTNSKYPYVLGTAGTYTLNGVEITTTKDNVEVSLTNGDTITFDAGAGISLFGVPFEGSGKITYNGSTGYISLAEGTVMTNVFEDEGITRTITANTAAENVIQVSEDSFTIANTDPDTLTIELTNTENFAIMTISAIEGAISYSNDVMTLNDGTSLTISIYDFNATFSNDGGISTVKFEDERTTYTAGEGATFKMDYLDGTVSTLQNGSIIDTYETYTNTLTEGSILSSNDTDVNYRLATAGTYTLNGNEITTTKDNVEVELTNLDTVSFDADAGVIFGENTFGGDGTVSITNGEISLGEGAYIAGEKMEEAITADGLIYTPVGDNTILTYDSAGKVAGIAAGAVEITQENSDNPKITVDGSTPCNFTAEAATDAIKMNVEGGKVSYTVTDGTSRAFDFEVEGSIVLGGGGNISPLAGAVLTETFADGNTLKVTANADATNAINFPAANSLQFEPANSTDLTLDLSFGGDISIKIDNIDGTISYSENTVTLDEGSKVSGKVTAESAEIPLAFEVTGGAGSAQITGDKMIFTVSDGATLTFKGGDNEFTMTEGVVTALMDGSGKSYLAAGTVMNGNSQNPVILETAGSYNINGEEFTSTADNVEVYLTNFDTVEFESDAAITYNGHTFDGAGKVKIVDGVLYFTMTEAGVLNLDERIFNLTENVPQGMTISLIENGFQVSRVLSEEEVTANNWDASDAGKTFSEIVEITNDDSYTIQLQANGIKQIDGISNGAVVQTSAIFDGQPDENGNYFTVSTDEVGKITLGDKVYEITGDTNITFTSRYYTDDTSKIQSVAEFDQAGEISGNFSGISSINGGTVSIVSGADNASVVNDGTDLLILGVDGGSAISLGGDNVFVQVTDSMTVNDVTYKVSGDSDGVLVSGNNITGLDANASLTISAAGTYKINGTEFTTEKDDVTISLAAGNTLEFEFDDGQKLTITLNTENAGTILISEDGGITVTPASADALTVKLDFGDNRYITADSIEGTVNLNDGTFTFEDGAAVSGVWNITGNEEENFSLNVSGGTATLTGTADALIFTANEGATFANKFGENETFTISDGSISVSTDGSYTTTISAGTVVTDTNSQYPHVLETAGTYSLNGKEITTINDNVKVYLKNDDISFVMYEVGKVTVDGKTFELIKAAPDGATVKPTENGVEISHSITAEEIEHFKNAGLFNLAESDVGKTMTETFTVTGDDNYAVELTGTGIDMLKEISDGANIKASVKIDGETFEEGTTWNILTNSAGTFTFGDKSYKTENDDSVIFFGKFAGDETFELKKFGRLDEGAIVSGNFNGEIAAVSADANRAEITISGGADNASVSYADSNILLAGVADGASITEENINVEVKNSMTVNDVTYNVNGDADGVLVADKEVAGLDENASLTVSEAGSYTVNTTPLEITENDVVIGLNSTQAYIDNGQAQLNPSSTTEEILDAFDVAASDAVIIPATAEGEQRVTLGNEGGVAVVEATETPVTITGGSGDDTLVTKGDNVKFNMGYGGTDKVMALGGNVTLQNYDPRGESGLQLTKDDMKEGVKFGDGTVELANATVSMNDNFVNLYDVAGNKSQVGFATNDDKLVDASGVTDGVSLLAGGENVTNAVTKATLQGGSGNDSIYGGEKSQIKPGAGNDFVEMSSLGGSTVNYTSGNDTISGLNFAGGDVAADTIRATVTESSLSGDDVILTTDNGTITIADGKNKDIVIGNEIWQVGDNIDFDDTATKYIAKGSESSLTATELSGDSVGVALDSIEGDVKYVDLSSYEGAASITGSSDADNVITASEGGSTIDGNGGNNSLKGGSGADEFISSSGENTIANFEFYTGENKDTADKLNTGEKAINGVKVSGDDIILKYDDGSAKVEGASGQTMQLQNEHTSDTPILAQFADDSLTVDEVANFYWAGGKNAAVIIGDGLDSKSALAVDLSNADFNNAEQKSFYGDIKELDASGFAGAAELTGNNKNNIITASEGGSTLNGGGGNNSLKGGSGADEFISESGKNTIANFEFYAGNNDDTADMLNLGAQAISGVNVSGDDVILKYDGGLAKIEGGAGQTIQLQNEHTSDTPILAQFAKDSLTVDETAKFYWASGKNATVSVGEYSGNVEVDLSNADFNDNSKLSFYGDIREIDASGYNKYTELTGNDKNNVLKAGDNGSVLWGGNGGNDTLIGGDGTDIFIYQKGNGDDVIQNISADDLISFEDLTLDDIMKVECTDSSIKFKFSGGGSLTAETDSPESVKFAPDDETSSYTYSYNRTTGEFDSHTQGSY